MAFSTFLILCFMILPFTVCGNKNETIYHTMLFVKVLNYTGNGQYSNTNISDFSGTCCRKMPLQNCTHFCETVFLVCIGRCDKYLFNFTYIYDSERSYDENYGIGRIDVPSIRAQNVIIDVQETHIDIKTGISKSVTTDRFTKKYGRQASPNFWISRRISWQTQNDIKIDMLAFCESEWYNPLRNCEDHIPVNDFQMVHYSMTEHKLLPDVDCKTEETSKINFITSRPYKYTKTILEAQLAKFLADKVCSSIVYNISVKIESVRYKNQRLRVVFNSHCSRRRSSMTVADEYSEISDFKISQALLFLSPREERDYFIDPVERKDISSSHNKGRYQLFLRLKRFINPNRIYFENIGGHYHIQKCPLKGCTPAFYFMHERQTVRLPPKRSPANDLKDCFGNLVNPIDTSEHTDNTILMYSNTTWDLKEHVNLTIRDSKGPNRLIGFFNISLAHIDAVGSSYIQARPKLISYRNNATNVSVEVEVMVWCSTGYYGNLCNSTCPDDDIKCNIAKCIVGKANTTSQQRVFHCRKGKCTEGACVCPDGYAGEKCSVAHSYTLPFDKKYNFLMSTNNASDTICKEGFKGFNCDEKDYCFNDPCKHGRCSNTGNIYTCSCDEGYKGFACDGDIDYCTSDTCQNNGTCHEEISNFTCSCHDGYTGRNCETDIDYCTSDTCHNNGTCQEEVSNYTCSCLDGYTGRNCETDVDYCASDTCQNNGTCQEEISNYTCSCLDGYTGRNCETNIDYCASDTCRNNGLCQEEISNYTCSCLDRYTGRNCETDINCCASHTCQNNGTCQEEISNYTCSCLDGYTGRNCETDIDYCASDTCHNNGTCQEEISNYTCSCHDGYTGRNCETDIDYCAHDTCQNNGTCLEEISNYTCSCATGYTGRNCIENIIHYCTENACSNNGTCIEATGNVSCQCSSGFGGRHCEIDLKNSTKTRDAIDASCSTSGWNISVNITALKQLYPLILLRNIHFGENSCRGKEVGNVLLFQQSFGECLTSKQISGNALLYVNDLYYAIYDPNNPFIIRRHEWTFSVQCDVNRNQATSSHVHHDVNAQHIEILGQYGIKMAFFKDVNFMNQLPGNPLHVNVGDDIYVKVFTTASDWTTKMRLHTCYTKPYDVAERNMTYYIIKDGCEVDSNTHIISQSTHETRFVFQDFEYSINREGLDIYCNATFCDTKDYSPGCAQSCISPGTQALIGK